MRSLVTVKYYYMGVLFLILTDLRYAKRDYDTFLNSMREEEVFSERIKGYIDGKIAESISSIRPKHLITVAIRIDI